MFTRKSSKTQFEILSQIQLMGKMLTEYHPVWQSDFERSEFSYSGKVRSVALSSLISGYKKITSPIIYMYSSSLFMVMRSMPDAVPVSPSFLFDEACARVLEIIDSEIDEMPSDLLVLHARHSIISSPNLRGDVDRVTLIREIRESLASEDLHSHVRYYLGLLQDHLEGCRQSNFIAFKMSVDAIDRVGIFHENKVSDFALDVFPSLRRRVDELCARRAALEWRADE
jgi:hypothetical protein